MNFANMTRTIYIASTEIVLYKARRIIADLQYT